LTQNYVYSHKIQYDEFKKLGGTYERSI